MFSFEFYFIFINSKKYMTDSDVAKRFEQINHTKKKKENIRNFCFHSFLKR